MDIVELFGKYLQRLCESNHPKAAGWLLKTGWRMQGFRLTHFPDKRLSEADRFVGSFMMRTMMAPLIRPEKSVMVSIFTPCEIMQEAGLVPYNVEGYSSYLSGSKGEGVCVQAAEKMGIPETLCSYHKTFIGAETFGVLPKPRFIVYTNAICDANMLTFKHLEKRFGVPAFFLDVPSDYSEESLDLVEKQLRLLGDFVSKNTGVKISEDSLRTRVERSKTTMEGYIEFLKQRSTKFMPTDVTSPMFCALSNNVMLGTEDDARYIELLLKEMETAGPKRGKHIYFMHTIPFWPKPILDVFYFNDKYQIVSDELGYVSDPDYDTENPYRAMAHRLLFNHGNGTIKRRIEMGIKKAELCKADGVIWFNHWGCKHTLGGSMIAKKMFEEAGFPTLILDGDGCDRAYGGEGQMATRLGAFLEILNQ